MKKHTRLIVTLLMIVVLAGGYFVNRTFPHALKTTKPLYFGNSVLEHPLEGRWVNYSEDYLATLRSEYALDELVAHAVSDIERVAIVTNWVHNLWQHHGSNAPEESHPLFILREVAKGERFRCVEYSVVITGCLQALGIDARTLGLKMKDVETRSYAAGHVVAEAYLKDMDKWVVVDGQWNAIPFIDSTPLNAVELQTAIALKSKDLTFPLLSKTQNLMYKKWISPYLYYFDVTLNETNIMLAPEGAKEPTVFQRKWPLTVDVFTHSVRGFYPSPFPNNSELYPQKVEAAP